MERGSDVMRMQRSLEAATTGERLTTCDELARLSREVATLRAAYALDLDGLRAEVRRADDERDVRRAETARLTAERDADRPGGELTRVRSGRVTITAVNAQTGTVSFSGPGGMLRTVTPKNPEVLAFTRSLRVGQQVDMTYEEALAISIEPMAPLR